MRPRKLHHPLWTHIPAVALLGYIIYRFVAAMPLPERVPLHFDIAGNPNRWGSPWELFAVFVGLGLLYLGISILADELWARQESRKAFNWLSLFDEATIAIFAAIIAHYGDFRHAVTVPGWTTIAAWIAVSIVLASFLEYMRPFIPHADNYRPEDTSLLESEIGSFVEEGKPWVYWESQNPAWMNWIIAAAIAFMLSGAWQVYRQAPMAAIPLALMTLVFVALYGGMRVMVTPDRIQARLGIFGIPMLKLRLAVITSVQVHEFSPLREFGGYGIRFNRQMKGYFFRGNRGVLIETDPGKKYLIGSDHPERLAAVLDVARRMAGG